MGMLYTRLGFPIKTCSFAVVIFCFHLGGWGYSVFVHYDSFTNFVKHQVDTTQIYCENLTKRKLILALLKF